MAAGILRRLADVTAHYRAEVLVSLAMEFLFSWPWKEIIDYGGFTLAFLALFFAIRQFLDARQHTKELGALAKKTVEQQNRLAEILEQAEAGAQRLEVLSESLPTRFIGTFPDSVGRLADFVQQAKRELVIVSDYAGFGAYSVPRPFAAYFQAIRRRCVDTPRIDVKMVIYTRKAGEAAAGLQFGENDWERISQSSEFTNFYRLFADRFASPPGSFKEWNNQSWEMEDWYRHALKSCGADVRETDASIPVFLWIRDDEDAIISFQSSAEFNDVTFRTSDAGFIQFFRKQFDRAYSGAAEYQCTNAVQGPVLAL